MRKIANHMRAFRQAVSGAISVEFALLFPVAVVLVVGAWDVGRFINTASALTNLSRSGLQFAMTKYWDEATVEQAVLDEAERQGMDGITVAAAATCECPDGTVPLDCAPSNVCGASDNPLIFYEVSTTTTYDMTIPYPYIDVSTITRSGRARIR